MSDDPARAFLSRWSRRKVEARAAAAAPSPAAPQTLPALDAAQLGTDQSGAENSGTDDSTSAPAEAQLPDPETLHGLQSEYRDFLRPEVDESLRRAALKKLFADPHFNVMDGLDIYIDDYSKPDPIPEAMLRSMNQARGLGLFSDEDDAQPAAATAAAPGATQQLDAQQPPTELAAEQPQVETEPTHCPLQTEATVTVDPVTREGRKNG